jgi:replicative DNA helicase
MTSELLPSSIDTERFVLGSVLLDGNVMDAARGTIAADDFILDSHRRIWAAMCRIYDAGATVDRVTVYHDLDEHREAQSVGGLSYLVDLDNGLPAMPALESYIGILKEKATLRRILTVTEAIGKRAQSGRETATELRAALTDATTSLQVGEAGSSLTSTREMIDLQGIDALLRPRRTEGVRLPWTALNGVLCGLHPGQMITVGAATGRGKSSFALQVAAHATRQGKSPVIWTLEMTPQQMFSRMVNQMSLLDSDRARHDALSGEEREKRRESAYWLHGHPVWLDARSRTITSFLASVREAVAKSDVGLVVVDYLQLVRFSGRVESRTREVGENSRSLKLAALELNLPFLVLSQFKRLGQERDYTINDFKECGDVENDSDVALILNAGVLNGDQPTPVKITVGKQREGPAGHEFSMMFHPPSQTFYSPEDR